MEVTHVKDHVTHAVIGGQEAQSFGISDDPAFFHVLSNTLYRDKERAVVRETLCNGWDAHIEAGLLNKPLMVTLTENKLTIQDFGFGISKDLIKPIYGVYGASTKKKNKNVTGGFGLGCKAPFAYVDHFEVTSCHEGEKTIYRMSKSSGAVAGKPSIQPIMSVPTTDSGITVTMNIKSRTDYEKFDRLIRQIAYLGEMLVNYNGEILPTVPFSQAKYGFIAVKDSDFGAGSEHPIQVRYGNVVYPVELDETYASVYHNAKNFLTKINRKTNVHDYYRASIDTGWVLILQAEADTISVTPSRESLSMTDHTIETIKSLLESFEKHTMMDKELEPICHLLVRDAISATWLTDAPVNLLNPTKSVPNLRTIEKFTSDYITEAEDVGAHLLRNKYPEYRNFWHRDIMMRLNALIQSGFGKRGLIQTYRAEYLRLRNKKTKERQAHNYYDRTWKREPLERYSHWFLRRIAAPLIMKLKAQPKLDDKRMFVWISGQYGRGRSSQYATVSLLDYAKRGYTFGAYMPFLRGIVILAYNRTDIEVRSKNFPMMKHWFGEVENNLCYIVPRNKDRVDAARKFFTSQGYTILDLTERQKWEPEHAAEPIEKFVDPGYVPKKRPKGWPTLNQLGPMGQNIGVLFSEDADRTELPEFYVQLSPRQEYVKKLDKFNETCVAPIVRLFGSRGVAIVSSAQLNKVKASGAVALDEFVFKQIHDRYKNDRDVKKYYERTPMGQTWQTQTLLDAIYQDPTLIRKFNLPKPIVSQEIKDMATIIGQFNEWEERYYPQLKSINALKKKWKLNTEIQSLIDSFDSLMGGIVNQNNLAKVLNATGPKVTPEIKNRARTILLSALKG